MRWWVEDRVDQLKMATRQLEHAEQDLNDALGRSLVRDVIKLSRRLPKRTFTIWYVNGVLAVELARGVGIYIDWRGKVTFDGSEGVKRILAHLAEETFDCWEALDYQAVPMVDEIYKIKNGRLLDGD